MELLWVVTYVAMVTLTNMSRNGKLELTGGHKPAARPFGE